MGVFWCTKKPCVGELADLADELEAKAEFCDAVGDRYGGRGGVVVEQEVVKVGVVTLSRDAVCGGEEGYEEDEGDDERVSAWHFDERERRCHVRIEEG